MDGIILAVIIFVAIAGPTLLALALYWRNNPDRRLSWRRAAEEAANTDPEHFRRPSAQWLFFGSGGDSSGGGRRRGRQRGRFQLIASSVRGSNPAPCCLAVRGPCGEGSLTCDSYWPGVTAGARRGPAVPGAARTQRGPASL
jgi:hypothetical protein